MKKRPGCFIFIKKERWLLSCTYKSVDMLSFVINRRDILIIIDEFHNLSINNISNKSNPFYKLLKSNNKILLMSATPRIYDLEYINYEIEDSNENDSDDSPEEDPEQYIVDTTNLIKQNILEYVDNGGYPLCEYLDFYNLEKYVKWLLEQT